MNPRVKLKAIEILQTETLTRQQLADRAFCHKRSAGVALNQLLAERKIHICDWARAYNQPVPVYKIGRRKNKLRPDPMTMDEKNAKRLADPEYLWRRCMEQRAKRIIEKVGI